jgi:hypothetical protein
MQGMTDNHTVPAPFERVVVKPTRDSRLESLLCEYKLRKQEAADAEQRFKDLKSAIAAELEDLYPAEVRPSKGYEIPASSMYPELTINYKTQEYLPGGEIKKHFPAIYESFKRESSFVDVRERQIGGQRHGGRR